VGSTPFGSSTNEVFDYAVNLLTISAPRHVAVAGNFSGDGYAGLVWENSVTGGR
jgi:hypothetical protein